MQPMPWKLFLTISVRVSQWSTRQYKGKKLSTIPGNHDIICKEESLQLVYCWSAVLSLHLIQLDIRNSLLLHFLWRDNVNPLKMIFCFNLPRTQLSATRDRSVLYKHKNRAPIMGVGNDMGWVCLIGPNGVWRVRLIIMSLQNVIPRPRNWLCLHQMSSRDPKAELWLFQQRPFNDGVTCPFVMVVGSVKRSLPDIWIQEITWFRERWPVAVLEIHFERCWRA